jgi:hypothetical protein
MRDVESALKDLEGPMMHALTMVLLAIALVCDVQEVRSGSPAEFLVAGVVIMALVVHDLLRDRRGGAPV